MKRGSAWSLNTHKEIQMKRKNNSYRCSSCNKIVAGHNMVYKCWNMGPPEESPVVGICRQCNADMKKVGYDTVLNFVETYGGSL